MWMASSWAPHAPPVAVLPSSRPTARCTQWEARVRAACIGVRCHPALAGEGARLLEGVGARGDSCSPSEAC